jgi:uncharacterized ParB-like nuclease family protein
LVLEEHRAREDFDSARFRAFRRALLSTLTGRARHLASFEEVLAAARPDGRAAGGIQEIPLDKVVGSAQAGVKAADFDAAFLPINRRLRQRWTAIYRAMTEGAGDLPPIDVYKVGDNYYVIDGHHRVSVARALGRETIAARVTEVKTRAPLGDDVDAAALLRAAEYAHFLETTQLDRTRPGARLECSRLGRYEEILRHILGHRYFLGLERGHEPSVEEAAASWYDNVYLPVVELIRKHRVLDQLPGWTEADAYVEVTRRWLALSEAGADSGPRPALEALLDEGAKRWWQRRRPAELR